MKILAPTTAAGIGAIPASEKGAAGGVAELDGDSRLPSDQMPEEVDARIQVLSGTDAALSGQTLALGEIAAPTDKSFLRRGDGVTQGGITTAGGVFFRETGSISGGPDTFSVTQIPVVVGLQEIDVVLVISTYTALEDLDIYDLNSTAVVLSEKKAGFIINQSIFSHVVTLSEAVALLITPPSASGDVYIRYTATIEAASVGEIDLVIGHSAALAGLYSATNKRL